MKIRYSNVPNIIMKLRAIVTTMLLLLVGVLVEMKALEIAKKNIGLDLGEIQDHPKERF